MFQKCQSLGQILDAHAYVLMKLTLISPVNFLNSFWHLKCGFLKESFIMNSPLVSCPFSVIRSGRSPKMNDWRWATDQRCILNKWLLKKSTLGLRRANPQKIIKKVEHDYTQYGFIRNNVSFFVLSYDLDFHLDCPNCFGQL